MILVRARIVLQRITWRREVNPGNGSSDVVLSWVKRSLWEQEQSAQDCWAASEPQRQVAVFHRETRRYFASQRRWSYSKPTFGSNTTNSAASRMTKFQAGPEMKTTLRPWRLLRMKWETTSMTTPMMRSLITSSSTPIWSPRERRRQISMRFALSWAALRPESTRT